MSQVQRVTLTSELIEAFAGTFLSPLYDNPQPTPDLHRECWSMYCSGAELAAVAAPRSHAKSTALTHDYVLAVTLFREQDFIVLISNTEDLAMAHLADIAKELRENEDLIAQFKIKGFTVDMKTDIIVEFQDGHQCRVIAKGSGQKMRGLKWNGKRPGLIVCDDLEDDAQIENKDSRDKFQRWFLRAVLPTRRRGGMVRVHGTILHEDSLLAKLMKAKTWVSKLYKAHAGFDDFSDILWPEQFPEERLREIRQDYIEQGDAGGYSQEYLNDRGWAMLAVLDEVAAAHDATLAQVSLAWLMRYPGVVSPIASATSPDQVRDIMGAGDLQLTDDEFARLDAVGR